MDCGERRSHARGVYPTQDTSRMGTARVRHKSHSKRVVSKKYGRKESGHHKEDMSQTRLNQAGGPNYRAPRGMQVPYYRLD